MFKALSRLNTTPNTLTHLLLLYDREITSRAAIGHIVIRWVIIMPTKIRQQRWASKIVTTVDYKNVYELQVYSNMFETLFLCCKFI